jgi:hypothetical protein
MEIEKVWNDPIVEETRRLRDAYASKFNYNIHDMVEDLKQWERLGFPVDVSGSKSLKPIISSQLRTDDSAI